MRRWQERRDRGELRARDPARGRRTPRRSLHDRLSAGQAGDAAGSEGRRVVVDRPGRPGSPRWRTLPRARQAASRPVRSCVDLAAAAAGSDAERRSNRELAGRRVGNGVRTGAAGHLRRGPGADAPHRRRPVAVRRRRSRAGAPREQRRGWADRPARGKVRPSRSQEGGRHRRDAARRAPRSGRRDARRHPEPGRLRGPQPGSGHAGVVTRCGDPRRRPTRCGRRQRR